jgi:membrane protein DedA with SNARE-associated domain
MTAWENLTSTVWWLLDEHGLTMAFVLLLLEESGLPPIIPGDLLMVLVGLQAAQGRYPLIVALGLLEIATLLGGSLLYWLSSVGGHAVIAKVGRHVGATPERLTRLSASLERHGMMAIVIGRLVPSLCILTAVVAGLVSYPYRKFVLALALGGFIHLAIFVMLGYWVGRPVLRVLSTLHPPFEVTASVLALAALLAWLAWSARRTPKTPFAPLPRSERMRRGLLAGLIGALAATLLANALVPLSGLVIQPPSFGSFGPFVGELAERGSIRAIVFSTTVSFLGVSMLWGALFGIVQPALPGPWWLRGVIFAVVPLGVTVVVVLPLTGGGLFGLALGAGLLPLAVEVARALVYGLTLGVAYTVVMPHRLAQAKAAA